MQKLDFNDYSFWAAANNTEAMSITERQRIKVWLNHCFSEFSTALKKDDLSQVDYAE
jgi:hypothetical protein